jgi:hypothetical protein
MSIKVGLIVATAVLFTAAPDTHMVIVKGKDVTGEVIKRLGLPNQNYCWEQCIDEARCTGTRWGVVSGSTAGQCQLMTGALTFGEPHEIKTQDGLQIVVVASRKEAKAEKSSTAPNGT